MKLQRYEQRIRLRQRTVDTFGRKCRLDGQHSIRVPLQVVAQFIACVTYEAPWFIWTVTEKIRAKDGRKLSFLYMMTILVWKRGSFMFPLRKWSLFLVPQSLWDVNKNLCKPRLLVFFILVNGRWFDLCVLLLDSLTTRTFLRSTELGYFKARQGVVSRGGNGKRWKIESVKEKKLFCQVTKMKEGGSR